MPRTPSPEPDASNAIGLALGGGGARGLAHIVILETFDELGIRPVMIAGTSIGAIFGGAYAAGLTAKEIGERAREFMSNPAGLLRKLFSGGPRDWMELWSLRPFSAALMNAEKFLEIVFPEASEADMGKLKIPFRATATDYREQSLVVIEEGSLGKAVAASMALPSLFRAVEYQGRVLADGGLINPLPYDLLQPESRFAVAIDVTGHARLRDDRPPGALEAMLASSQIMQNAIVHEKLKRIRPDILIRPAVETIRVLEFYRINEILEASAPSREQLKRELDRVLTDGRGKTP